MLADLETKPTFGKPKPFRLGVMIEELDGEVKIDGVSEDSIAEKAGLQKGDVILSVDGTAIENRRNIVRILRRDRGKTVEMKVKRDGEEVTLKVELKN